MAVSLHEPLLRRELPYATLDRHWLDLTARGQDELELRFAASVWAEDLFLVIDIYSAANPVHPEGHVGWWKWPLEEKEDIVVTVTRGPRGISVEFNGNKPAELWTNPAFTGSDEAALAVHVVLRDAKAEAIEFDDTIYLYQSQAARDASLARQAQLAITGRPASTPWYVWPHGAKVHIAATNIFERDAVGNFALSIRQLLAANGIPCQLYAEQFDPALRGLIRHTCNLVADAAPEDLLLVHLSIVDSWLPGITQLPARKLLYFHNITPPRFFQVYDAEYAAHCSKGVEQIAHARQFDVLLANSCNSATVLRNLMQPKTKSLADDDQAPELNGDGQANGHARQKGPFEDASRLLERAARILDRPAHEDVKIHVCPPLVIERRGTDIPDSPIDLPAQKSRLLYVGRIAPHKRIEDLLALFAEYRRLDSDSALLLVGGASFSGYMGYLRYLIEHEFHRGQSHIHFLNSVTRGQLETIYRSASALISMSEHEGFCLPLVEAMAHDVPVFAYADDAVRETLGKSGRLFMRKDYSAIARDIHDVLSHDWKRALVLEQQRRRLAEIREAADGRVLWQALEEGLLSHARAV